MIQSVSPSLFISPYNPLRFIEQDYFARCYDLNPTQTLYSDFNNQPGIEVQSYAQPYSYADRLVLHFYSRYNNNRINLIDATDSSVVDTFELTSIPNQILYTVTGSAVMIDNDPSLNPNTVIRLITGLLDGIIVNGVSNAWSREIGQNLVGGKILITADDRLLEATVIGYQNGNFDWLVLDQVINLSSWSTTSNINLEVRKRADLAYYYQHQIDLCDYEEGCYRLIIEADYLDAFDTDTYEKSVLQVSRTVESEVFNLKKTQPYTNTIRYKNYPSEVDSQEIDWSAFSDLDFFELRVESQFLPSESNTQKNNIFRAANNVQIVSNQSFNPRLIFNTGFLPWYVHEKLGLIFTSDSVKVNNLSVIANEGYKFEALTSVAKSLGSVELSQREGFIENLS